MLCYKCKINIRVAYNSYCKTCVYSFKKEWRKKYPERWQAEQKRYRNRRKLGQIWERPVRSTSKIPLVYCYFNPLGEVVYVGRGSLKRAKSHRYLSNWWNPTLFLLSMSCENEWEAMEYEGKWGNRYKPYMNKDGYRYEVKGEENGT